MFTFIHSNECLHLHYYAKNLEDWAENVTLFGKKKKKKDL